MNRSDIPPVEEGGDAVRVLIIDDEMAFRDTLAKVLERRGMAVATAAGGSEGLALAEANDYDVVVLDLRMPGLDGLTVLERLMGVRPDTRVIVLTGHATVEAGVKAIQQLAFDFLLKPVEVSRLVEVIAAAAQARRAGDQDRSGGG